MGRAEPVDLLSFSAQVMFMAPASSLGTLLDQSAASLLSQLAAREISALDLMTATLDRIEALNPSVNALVGMADRGDLLAQARAKDAGPVQGPLHGLPIAVKVPGNVKGLVTAQGSPLFKDSLPGEADALAARGVAPQRISLNPVGEVDPGGQNNRSSRRVSFTLLNNGAAVQPTMIVR